jgi:hypothetical protein
MLVVSLKVPCDEGMWIEDYSHLCDEEPSQSSGGILRGVSNPNLLSESDATRFEECVRVADEPWKMDIIEYPADSADIESRPDLYNFDFSGLVCELRRTPYFTWRGNVRLPSDFTFTQSSIENLKVHGGIVCYRKQRIISFDCSHGQFDVSPFEPFARAEMLRRSVGDRVLDTDDLELLLPSSRNDIMNNYRAKTYKAYSFAKRELMGLASQLALLIS